MSQGNIPQSKPKAVSAYRWAGAFAAAYLLAASMALLAVACGGGESDNNQHSDADDAAGSATPFQLPSRAPTEMELPIRIAVTLPIFEEFARDAGGENVNVISLVPQDADPHSYEFTQQDIDRMKEVDFFFLNGLGLDSRLKDVIEANRDENSYMIPFAPNIRSPGGGGLTAEQAGDDGHLWLDPSLAYVYTEIVADELMIYDGIRRDYYSANFLALKERMLSLQDELYSRLRALPADRRKLITHHDAFDHFARRFEFEIAGYAAETPAQAPPPDSVVRLAETVREQGIAAVFADYGYDAGMLEEVAVETGAQVCVLYSDIGDPGLTYEQMMGRNADEILRCLGS